MKRNSILFFLLVISVSTQAQRILIHCGHLIDGKSNEVVSESTIVVEGN